MKHYNHERLSKGRIVAQTLVCAVRVHLHKCSINTRYNFRSDIMHIKYTRRNTMATQKQIDKQRTNCSTNFSLCSQGSPS